MKTTRREILKYAGAVSAAVVGGAVNCPTARAAEGHGHPLSPDVQGVLVDLADCVGCRLCEYACKEANGIPPGPLASYDDMSVLRTPRRPSPAAFTVINAWPAPAGAATSRAATPTASAPAGAVYTKVNCLHCNEPACVSACIVGALQKQPDGAVTYDAWKCIGCRYCMVACPFQIPAYEYDNALTPEVRKCELCHERTIRGELPGCVKACPRQALTFGKRSDLLDLARHKLQMHPQRYVAHIYGAEEVGGTSWLYLSPAPFDQVGLPKLGHAAPSALTEAIQHGVFKYWIAPLGWYAFLASAFWLTGRRPLVAASRAATAHENSATPPDRAPPPGAPRAAVAVAAAQTTTAVAELPPPETSPPARAASRAPSSDHAARTPNRTAERQPPTHPAPPDPAHAPHAPTAAPVPRKLLTPGVWVLLAMVFVGAGFGLYRFIFGLAAATNLDQQHPWGLWIAMDVGSGIALAGGGFVTAALVHIFHREHYHAVARSALLTALLGYTFYVPGLLADLGRWYNLWHPTIPTMWQGNSVLFEVGLCVMIYLNVQYAEMIPIICERFMGPNNRFPRLARWAGLTHDALERIMPALLILGVALSTFHQSSLGNLMVIAPYKLHALWWSPMSPVFFLLSAVMVGFPMVIFTLLFAAWCLKRRPDMSVLAPLSRYVPVFLAVYLAAKIGDMAVRGTYGYLAQPSVQSVAWLAEMALGVVLPLFMLLRANVRRSPRALGAACLMVILGVVLNRLNVFIIGYHPPYATKTYFPSVTECAVSLGLVAALMLTYRLAVTYLPILEPAPAAEAPA